MALSTMSEKERLMAIGIGSIVAFFLLFGGYRMVKGGFDAKKETLNGHLEELSRKKAGLKQAKLKKMQVAEYKRKSLHHSPRSAHLDFIHWLEKQLKDSGLDDPRVSFDSIPRTKKDMKQLSYQVTGVGDITQITRLLHRIHSADTLHRVRTLNLQKKKDGGINLSARIDALSLPKLEGKGQKKVAVGTINEAKVPRSLEEYTESIANRNIFSPANLPPEFKGKRKRKAYLGEELDIALEATDPEEAGVFFELDEDAPAWVELSKKGALSGEPEEIGEYKFKVYAVDKGIPAKETVINMTVKIEKKPVKKEKPEKKPEEFDIAKLAKLTAIVQGVRDPMPQMCLLLQDRDERQFLQQGDEIDIGKWQGNVIAVDPNSNTVLLQNDDGDYELKLGDMLSDARRLRKRDRDEEDDEEDDAEEEGEDADDEGEDDE